MATAKVIIKKSKDGYKVTSVIGGYVFKRATAKTFEKAEVKADVFENELLDAGYMVTFVR